MNSILSLFLLCTAIDAHSACPKFQRIYGSVDLNSKKWTTTNIAKTAEEFCEAIPSSPNGNLEVKVHKKNKKFSQKIYQSLDAHWDHPTGDGKFEGGKMPLKILQINTLIPDWYKGATLTIIDLATKKKITETKL